MKDHSVNVLVVVTSHSPADRKAVSLKNSSHHRVGLIFYNPGIFSLPSKTV